METISKFVVCGFFGNVSLFFLIFSQFGKKQSGKKKILFKTTVLIKVVNPA
jgi:hypothetical protein